jgi:uncharacterized Zn-binding protein involved in type VI secretion
MPAACRLTDLVQIGAIVGPGAPKVMIQNLVASTIGDEVGPHGEAPHTKATIATGSKKVKYQMKAATVQTISAASCGHSATTGSVKVIIGI